jgi:hypothetical protein
MITSAATEGEKFDVEASGLPAVVNATIAQPRQASQIGRRTIATSRLKFNISASGLCSPGMVAEILMSWVSIRLGQPDHTFVEARRPSAT